MKVILLDNIKGVGKKDQIINASDGYARNFLFPKKLAVEANNENMAKLKEIREDRDIPQKKLAETLKGILLKINVKAGENGKIFGSITSKEIADNLNTQYKIEVDKKKIDLKEPIKAVGTSSVTIKLYEGVTGTLRVQINNE